MEEYSVFHKRQLEVVVSLGDDLLCGLVRAILYASILSTKCLGAMMLILLSAAVCYQT
mgnify:CR=1 FL=1